MSQCTTNLRSRAGRPLHERRDDERSASLDRDVEKVALQMGTSESGAPGAAGVAHEGSLGERVRPLFPGLSQTMNGKRLVYLDSAATAMKPQPVLDALMEMYSRDCANVHRGAYAIACRATEKFERARDTIRSFHSLSSAEEIVFVRGATEGINLVAHSFVRPRLGPGDEVLITELEHHANIVPWQMVCKEAGAKLVVIPISASGELRVEDMVARISSRTKFAAFAHVSNVLGTILPVEDMVEVARQRGVPTLIDGAQAVPHMPVSVPDLGCDFYVWSAHKLYGPTGVGVLAARKEHLEGMAPYQGGGEMIDKVSFEETTYNVPPWKFEAGTPHMAGVVGMGAAVDFVQSLNWDALRQHDEMLCARASEALASMPRVRRVGTPRLHTSVFSFVVDGAHASDIGTMLDQQGVAVRTGHHCAQPLLARLGIDSSARISMGVYNTADDVDAFVDALRFALELCA